MPTEPRLRALDPRVGFALVYTAVILSLSEYWFIPSAAPRTGLPQVLRGVSPDLAAGLVWVASTVLLFTAIPMAVVRGWHREGLASIGFGTRGLRGHLLVYLGLYGLMVPVLLLVARRPDFSELYPLVPSARASLGVFWLWESAYALQFVALESFFRGYLLFTCAARMGWNAVPVMVVPYTMIHFHKPLPECLAAVGAGCLLGVLALRYRSFWGGAILHTLVAVSMDVLAVRRAGLF